MRWFNDVRNMRRPRSTMLYNIIISDVLANNFVLSIYILSYFKINYYVKHIHKNIVDIYHSKFLYIIKEKKKYRSERIFA